MKLSTEKIIISHGSCSSVSSFVVVVFIFLLSTAAAQPSPPQNPNMYARFSPSMAVIIAVLVAALFFMGFFSIYIRHCYDASGAAGGGIAARGLSMRARRAAAARGLDASVIETFPTFTYSEVKDHKIGKGALECAVCLNEFEDDETLRLLPKCDHVFHPECIDAWLESHVTCPVCRANLATQTGGEPVETAADGGGERDDTVERTESRNEEIVIQVDSDAPQPERNLSFELPNRPARSWSIRRPKMLGFGKFRSHSTGHSLVQPGENLERFTLRLPEGVRKEVMDRAILNRTRSLAAGLQREGSSRKGYRGGGEESSGRAGKFNRKLELPGRGSNSDRWVFFTRGLSFRSPRVVAESGEGSGSKRGGGSKTPTKMPSFKCLEPKTDGEDENRPLSGQPPV